MTKLRQVIVDQNDRAIGAKFRDEITSDDIYRVSSSWVVVPDGEKYKVLIAQRSFTKKHDPGKWAVSAAGTVDEGETYEENARKELGEEIGLTNVQLRPMSEVSTFRDGEHKYFSKRFVVIGDFKESDFTRQNEEVEALKLIDIDELLSDIDDNPEDYLRGMYERVIELKCFLTEEDHE